MNQLNKNIIIELGDSKDILQNYPDNFVDLIVTSPPYEPENYVGW